MTNVLGTISVQTLDLDLDVSKMLSLKFPSVTDKYGHLPWVPFHVKF